MCGIVGSFKKQKLVELSKLNSSRGNKAYSLFCINPKSGFVEKQFRQIGKFEEKLLDKVDEKYYFILHIQSPTKVTVMSESNIHPAETGDNNLGKMYLWHNGMLLNRNFQEFRNQYNLDTNWDTRIILEHLKHQDFDGLNSLDGSFGCILSKNKKFFIFRNNIIPIHVDKDLNISSAKFETAMKPIEANKIFSINFDRKKLDEIGSIENSHNPYNLLSSRKKKRKPNDTLETQNKS